MKYLCMSKILTNQNKAYRKKTVINYFYEKNFTLFRNIKKKARIIN